MICAFVYFLLSHLTLRISFLRYTKYCVRISIFCFKIGLKVIICVLAKTSCWFTFIPFPFLLCCNDICYNCIYWNNFVSSFYWWILPLHFYYRIPLTPYPHIHTLPKNLSTYHKPILFFRHNLCCRDPIQYSINICSGILKFNLLQFSPIHKLYSFSKFPFFKSFRIWNRKMFI